MFYTATPECAVQGCIGIGKFRYCGIWLCKAHSEEVTIIYTKYAKDIDKQEPEEEYRIKEWVAYDRK